MSEDDWLLQLTKNGQNWKEIAKHFNGHNEMDCRDWFAKLSNTGVYSRGLWNEDETALLRKYFDIYGGNYTLIAKKIPGRTAQ